MNKLVYLFELDSVRKTDQEIYKGQLAMYDELVGNGNIIVMSMNQITDSKTFLCMLEEQEHYNIIRELFEKGYIRVSRYGTIRTASQYVQNAIRKNLESNEDVFIFSALPVKSSQKFLLKLMEKVLVNADLSMIKEYIKMGNEGEPEILSLFKEYQPDGTSKESTIEIKKAREYLKFLYRFLELTLMVSMYDTSANPPIDYDEKYQREEFSNIMHKIMSFDGNRNEFTLWEEAVEILQMIEEQLENTEGGARRNNRSAWIKCIKQLDGNQNKESSQYAELIVDLCYNYTVEHSIYGVSKHYKRDEDIQSFQSEFFSRLKRDWNNGQDATYRFLQEETNEYVPYEKQYPDWERGIRIISRRKPYKPKSSGNQIIPLYEYCYHQQRRQEKREDIINILKVCITTVVYMMAIYGIDIGMSFFQNNIGALFKSFITFIILTIVSAIIDKVLPIPNILECIGIMRKSLMDFSAIIWRRPLAYINKDNLNTDCIEEGPKTLKQTYAIANELQEYITLWNTQPELFKSSEQIDIVNPNKEGIEEILEYEIINNKHIGVIYKSPYNMLVVDLIRNKDSTYSTYERLVPTVQKGAVVIVPIYQNKFVLLRQFRHAVRREQLAFPRGYGELEEDGKSMDAKKNVIKEIEEELGAKVVGEPQKLGNVIADSGISSNEVVVYTVMLDQYREQVGYEGIEEVHIKSQEEMAICIQNGEINDGYTLAAYTLYMSQK